MLDLCLQVQGISDERLRCLKLNQSGCTASRMLSTVETDDDDVLDEFSITFSLVSCPSICDGSASASWFSVSIPQGRIILSRQ